MCNAVYVCVCIAIAVPAHTAVVGSVLTWLANQEPSRIACDQWRHSYTDWYLRIASHARIYSTVYTYHTYSSYACTCILNTYTHISMHLHANMWSRMHQYFTCVCVLHTHTHVCVQSCVHAHPHKKKCTITCIFYWIVRTKFCMQRGLRYKISKLKIVTVKAEYWLPT